MHSEQTLQHLQHMVSRISSGATGEEKEVVHILYDEIYTLVRPIYVEDERSKKITYIILNKYVSKLPGRQVLDVVSDAHLYAIRCMYNTMKKDSETGEVFLENEKEPYPYQSVSDDAKFYQSVAQYNASFVSVHAYERMPVSFHQLDKNLLILMELFCFEECSVSHIAEFLKVPEKIIRQNLAVLRQTIIRLQHAPYQDEDTQKTKTVIDIVAAIVILIAGAVWSMM